MTEKELHKLRRQDLLELLLDQVREVSNRDGIIEELNQTIEQKDGELEKLKQRLNDKDAQISSLTMRLEEMGSALKRLSEDENPEILKKSDLASLSEEVRRMRDTERKVMSQVLDQLILTTEMMVKSQRERDDELRRFRALDRS